MLVSINGAYTPTKKERDPPYYQVPAIEASTTWRILNIRPYNFPAHLQWSYYACFISRCRDIEAQ